MKTTALIANIGLLVVMTWYLLSIESFQAEGLELVALVLALGAPILSIIALVMSRPTRGIPAGGGFAAPPEVGGAPSKADSDAGH